MATSYFSNFATVGYSFGNAEDAVAFNRLNQYVSVLQTTLDNITLFEKYTVISGERPDTLSYKLYGTTDHYWSFYLVNEHIRESGWAIPSYDLLDEAKARYPHRTITTNDDISTDNGSFERFPVGQVVTSGNVSGTIIRKIPEMGQIIIDTGGTAIVDTRLHYSPTEGNEIDVTIIAESAQYDSVHHYEDADGVHQDLTLFDFGTVGASLIPVTYRDRLNARNDELKEIVIIKPSAIDSVATQFKQEMKKRL
jgi:hypothetical protein